MRTRDEHKEALIKEKALKLIVKEGFDGFSMQKLAKAAKVSPATLYIYYKNREDLLNTLYNEVHNNFTTESLHNFSPTLSLTEGLWLQWQNRLRFILNNRVQFYFLEQFRNSPHVNHKDVKLIEFKEAMRAFVKNAMKRGELAKMEPEIFWSIAYGPLYALVKFHFSEKSLMENDFKITDTKLKRLLKMVLRALQNEAK